MSTVKANEPQARVTQILTSDLVVIDVGSADGVKSGDQFRIVAQVSIRDLSGTGEVIQVLDYVKAVVEASMVLERYTIAGLAWHEVQPRGMTWTDFPPKSLNVEPSEVEIPAESMRIRRGDLVRKVEREVRASAESPPQARGENPS